MFTAMSSRMTPQELIQMLSIVVMEFDRLTDDHEVEKIKTIGDAYIAVTGTLLFLFFFDVTNLKIIVIRFAFWKNTKNNKISSICNGYGDSIREI